MLQAQLNRAPNVQATLGVHSCHRCGNGDVTPLGRCGSPSEWFMCLPCDLLWSELVCWRTIKDTLMFYIVTSVFLNGTNLITH